MASFRRNVQTYFYIYIVSLSLYISLNKDYVQIQMLQIMYDFKFDIFLMFCLDWKSFAHLQTEKVLFTKQFALSPVLVWQECRVECSGFDIFPKPDVSCPEFLRIQGLRILRIIIFGSHISCGIVGFII